MRIKRSDDETVIAAGSNNSLYGQSNDDRFDYDMDISFSEMQVRNEIVKDRIYGTSNIKPMARNKSVMKERLYKEAIEESSRMKTGGYYNQIFGEMNKHQLHDNVPGRLKEKLNNETVAQINDALAYNMNYDKENGDISFRIEEAAFKMSKDAFNNCHNKKPEGLIPSVPIQQGQMQPPQMKLSPMQKPQMKQQEHINTPIQQPMMGEQQINNMLSSPFINEQGFVGQGDKYDDIMNKVNDDIIKQNSNDPSTKMMNESRMEIRQSQNKQNNIPYRKTAVFEKGSNSKKEKKDGLVVRDCKSAKNQSMGKSDKTSTVASRLFGMICMIIPVLGFIVSGIISLVVPKDKAYKNFARFCLTCHMLVSVAATYLYLSGTISIELIKSYISKF